LDRGDLAAAAVQAETGLLHFPFSSNDWHWRFIALKAEILLRQGLADDALALLRPELPSSLATSEVAVWRKLTQGAAAAYSLKYQESETVLREASGLASRYQPQLLGQVALRMGTLADLRGDISAAMAAYREALRIARHQKDQFLETSALGSLGLVATEQEHYDESLDWNRSALQLSLAAGARSSSARILGNMAWGYFELGDFDNALTFFKQAEEKSAEIGLVGDRIYWLIGVAVVHRRQFDYASAETVLDQALQLARSQSDKEILTTCLNNLSEVEAETGHLDLAETYSNEVVALAVPGLDPRLVFESVIVRGRIDESKHDYARAAESFQRVINDLKAGSAQRWEAEARLARVYADEGEHGKAETEFRHSLATIEGVRSSVQAEDLRLSFLSSAIGFYDDYIGFLISRKRAEDALQVAELSRARTLAEGLGAAPKTLSFPLHDFEPREIAQRRKSVLLFYWLGQKQSYLWVITPAKVTCLTLAGATEIDPLVKSYREALLGGRDVLASGGADGEKLYGLLVEPAKKLIPANSRVILLPDGSLYGLNFETLLAPSPKPHFWIEDVTVTTANSLTLLSAGRNARKQDAAATRHDVAGTFRYGNLLLVGDATQAAAEFPVLRQAQAEMVQVAHYFPEARRAILSGAHATPSVFLSSEPEKFAYLHFVTHGSASRAHPLDSAVILSPEGDSFKLYARDIVRHPLSAYLVTVSACNGSGTRAYSGEGLVGLSWAFLRAGAHNVIAALWEVNDASTPQLMDKLYGELSQGHDPATALRAAKLSLLHSDSVFNKPFYWAPFQLYGGS
jgi:CHAT domain-containing protein/Tfp pilus assembly protein PilF